MNANISNLSTANPDVAANLQSFKIRFEDFEIRRIPLIEQDSLLLLTARLRNLFSLPNDARITIAYKDLEGDQVTIGSEEEYQLALALHAGKNTISLSLFVVKNALVSLDRSSNFKGITSNEQQKYQHPHQHPYQHPHHHHGNKYHEKKEKVRKPVARFVKDVTFSENSEVEPGATFIKTWRFRNEGDFAWPSGILVKYIGKGGSDQMGAPETVPVPGIVQPNETVDVSVQLTSPTESGRYTGYWRLYDPTVEKKFGPRFWVQVTVPSGNSSPMVSSSSEDDTRKKKEHHDHHHRHHHHHKKNDKEQFESYVEIPDITGTEIRAVNPEDDLTGAEIIAINPEDDLTGTETIAVNTEDNDKKMKKKEKCKEKREEKREKKHKKNSGSSSSDSCSSEEEKEKGKRPKRVKMAELLGQLASMGFNDKGANVKLLKKYDRDLGKVVHALVEKIAKETTTV
jgi:hypothetical protein